MSQLELNKGDNLIFLFDVSGSMMTKDCPGNMARIDYLKERAAAFVNEAAKFDEDGVDLYTFGHKVTHIGNVTKDNAAALINPLKANESSTDTAAAIRVAYDAHKKGGHKQTVVMINTDGEPNDAEEVKNVIRSIAAEIKDEHEFAISILTVGVVSPALRTFLTDLDDNLNAKHDIVDVKALDEVDFAEAFSGALHD